MRAQRWWLSIRSSTTSLLKHKNPNFISHECRTQCNSNVTYLVACWPPWTVKDGDTASSFVKVLGLALAPKMCPVQSQAFKDVNNSQAFTVESKKWPFFVSGRAASRCPKACLYHVSRKYSKSWLRKTNIKSNLTPEIEYTLKPSNYDAKPWFLHFTAQNLLCPRRFEKMDPEIWHTCLMCPCRAFYEWGFLFFYFFLLEMWDPLRPKYPEKIRRPKYLAKKNRKKTFVEGSAGAIKHMCKISGCLSQ